MLMAVMQLGHVWVIVGQWQMPMRVCMRFLCDDLRLMFVLVVFSMRVHVIVLHLFMDMQMAMMGPQQESHTHRHGRAGGQLGRSPLLTENRHSGHGADEGRGRKISCFVGGSYQAESLHVQHETQTITEQP